MIPPDHILCSNDDQYEGNTGDAGYTYSENCLTQINRDDTMESGYFVTIGGEIVR